VKGRGLELVLRERRIHQSAGLVIPCDIAIGQSQLDSVNLRDQSTVHFKIVVQCREVGEETSESS
jgi:hypothetical protein